MESEFWSVITDLLIGIVFIGPAIIGGFAVSIFIWGIIKWYRIKKKYNIK